MVFEGGGVLGISFVGGIACLKEHGYSIERCAGTSAGAIVAALVVAGYTEDELFKLINTLNYKYLNKPTYVKGIKVPKLANLWFRKGLYNGNNIETWIEPLLKAKGITKFKDVMRGGNSRLKIVASDITTRNMLILPDDLIKYGIDPKEFSISEAVTMSASIPFYFTPTILKHDKKNMYIVDGGLLSNFPIWIFDVEGIPKWPTLGFNLKDSESRTMQGMDGFINYAKDVILAPLNVNEETFIRDKDLVRTITVKVPNIRATDFDLADKYAMEMYNNGYKAAEEFLKTWNFSRYVQNYRK